VWGREERRVEVGVGGNGGVGEMGGRMEGRDGSTEVAGG